jgi:hypothetical protein
MTSLRRWNALPIVAKVHDLGVCIWAAKLLFEGQIGPGLALLGWFSLIWILRITDLPGWLDWHLPEGTTLVVMTVLCVLLLEAFLVWLYWKDAVNWIVRHY